jgi:serine/threonine protein kinase
MAIQFELLSHHGMRPLLFISWCFTDLVGLFGHQPVYPGCLREEVEKTRGLTIDVAHFYIKQILAGVYYLHSHCILHRDLKLDNILLTQDGHAVICDFGLATMVLPDGRARRAFEEDPHLPSFYVDNQSCRFGTPQSTAPEVVLGNTYGFPSDMWSIGVMVYEIITGQPPWGGDFETASEFYQAIIGTDPDFVPRQWSDDVGLCLITQRLLRKDPSRRPAIGELLFSHVFLEL